MPATDIPPTKSRWWLETLIWSLAFVVAVAVAAYVNDTAREVIGQGIAYLFMVLTTPFILEASVAIIGIGIVFIVNSRRIEREGDGWVEMEVKDEAEAKPQEKTS